MATRETQAGTLAVATYNSLTRETQAGTLAIASYSVLTHETQAGVLILATLGTPPDPPTGDRRRIMGQVI